MIEKGYNVNEAAALLGMRPRTVRKWIKSGLIQAQKIAGTNRWLIIESEIRRLQNGKGIRAE